MCPGFRLMAMAMSGVAIARAGIPSRPTDMVNRTLVVRWEEQPTRGTAPALPCEPGGQSGADRRVAAPSGAPRDPIPLVRTPMARDLGVPPAGDCTMGGAIHLALRGNRRGKHPAGVPSRPVPVVHPPGRGVGVSPAGPVAALYPRAMIHPPEGGLTHPGAIIMGPTADFGVKVTDQVRLGPCPTAANDPPELHQMRLDVGLGGFDQGVDPAPLVAPGAFPGLVGSHPILTEMKPQNIHAGLIACQGVADVSVGHVQRQSDLCPPAHEAVLAVC